jgi:hypothetical protein
VSHFPQSPFQISFIVVICTAPYPHVSSDLFPFRNWPYSFQGSAFRQQNGDKVPAFSFEEAIELEQQAHAADLERKQRLLERREKQGLVSVKDRMLTREEQEARIWAFMCGNRTDHSQNLVLTLTAL